MTPSTKPVTRVTSAYVRDRGLRPLVVTVQGSIITLRAKGCRREEIIDIGACYTLAVKQRIARERSERKASRKGART